MLSKKAGNRQATPTFWPTIGVPVPCWKSAITFSQRFPDKQFHYLRFIGLNYLKEWHHPNWIRGTTSNKPIA